MDIEHQLEEKLLNKSHKRILKPKEVANLLGVTERTLRNWAKSGKIQTLRTAGGHYRYSLESVLYLLLKEQKGGEGEGEAARPSAALYARGPHYAEIQRRLDFLRQSAAALGLQVVYEEYDVQRGHQLGWGLQRLLIKARERTFRIVLVTSYSQLGWLGAAEPRFFHLTLALLGVQLIPLSTKESVGPAELLDDFIALHELLSEYLDPPARRVNREILKSLARIRKSYPLEDV